MDNTEVSGVAQPLLIVVPSNVSRDSCQVGKRSSSCKGVQPSACAIFQAICPMPGCTWLAEEQVLRDQRRNSLEYAQAKGLAQYRYPPGVCPRLSGRLFPVIAWVLSAAHSGGLQDLCSRCALQHSDHTSWRTFLKTNSLYLQHPRPSGYQSPSARVC